MKEQLKALKNCTIEIVKERTELKNQIEFFNMKVTEQKQQLNIEEIFLTEENDSYEAAKILVLEIHNAFSNFNETLTEIRNSNPNCELKKIKELLIQKQIGNNNFANLLKKFKSASPEEVYMNNLLDNYFLYENCGFDKVQEQEEKIANLAKEAGVSTEEIWGETKAAAKKVGTTIANIAKPYGEVAKSQLGDAKVKATGLAIEGAKKLIKILEDSENKTNK